MASRLIFALGKSYKNAGGLRNSGTSALCGKLNYLCF
jgi:hypothetical protein